MTAVGTVVEIKNDFRSAGDGQYIYIKFDTQPEGVSTVLRPGKKLKADTMETPFNVEVYETEGEVKILGKVNSEENVYRALILKSNTLVASGSIVVPGKMKTFKLSESTKETTAGKGRIIGNLTDHGIVGQGSFVVINQGSQGGYQPNMKLPVFEDLEGRRRHAGALLRGRFSPSLDDLNFVASSALRHRIELNWKAKSNNIKIESLISEILNNS